MICGKSLAMSPGRGRAGRCASTGCAGRKNVMQEAMKNGGLGLPEIAELIGESCAAPLTTTCRQLQASSAEGKTGEQQQGRDHAVTQDDLPTHEGPHSGTEMERAGCGAVNRRWREAARDDGEQCASPKGSAG